MSCVGEGVYDQVLIGGMVGSELAVVVVVAVAVDGVLSFIFAAKSVS